MYVRRYGYIRLDSFSERGSNILLPRIHTCTPRVVPMPDPGMKIPVAKYLSRSYVDIENPVSNVLNDWLQHPLDKVIHMHNRNNWC